MSDCPATSNDWLSAVEGSISSVVGIVILSALSAFTFASFYYRDVLGFKSQRHKLYENGISVLFAFRVLAMGPGFQSLMKITSSTTRRRLYSGYRRFLFCGREIWTAGHPALLKHIFSPANAKLWRKVDKPLLSRIFFQREKTNNAMLYTGDDERWKHARETWTPFFTKTDFSAHDSQIDEIVEKHLLRLLKYRQGRAELLELLLFITVDLLCQVLYGANLPQDELNILVEALAEYTVPATPHRGVYPGGLDAYDYHSKVAKEISDKAPDGVFAKIIMKDEHMSETNRYENCAFFLEALTPVFASFWTLCNVMLMSNHDATAKETCLDDPVFREKCIKESLRMYPPVPVLWARIANKTHSFDNPLYDASVKDNRSLLGKLFSSPDFRTVKSIVVKKDTMVFTVPACLHYDDRFWLNPEEFLPSRWDKDPSIIKSNSTTVRLARKTCWGALSLRKEEDIEARLAREKASLNTKKSAYDNAAAPLRYKLFGSSEHDVEVENYEHFKVVSENEDYMAWSFFPFGLGQHMCLGRRLAVKLVDGIVANLLAYDIKFANGNTPNLFKRHWTDRLNAVSAVYNYPADPVFVEFGDIKGDINRIDTMFVAATKKKRNTRFTTMNLAAINEFSLEDEERSALLLITCQNEFLDPEGKLFPKVQEVMEKLGTKKHLKELVDAAITGQSLIIHAPVEIDPNESYEVTGFDEWKVSSLEGMFIPGSWNAELYQDTAASIDDIILAARKTPDLVAGTNLLSILQQKEIVKLYIAGLLTDVSVENTVRDLSKKLNGKITLHPVSDATATLTMEAQSATFKTVLPKFSQPVTTDEAVRMLTK